MTISKAQHRAMRAEAAQMAVRWGCQSVVEFNDRATAIYDFLMIGEKVAETEPVSAPKESAK